MSKSKRNIEDLAMYAHDTNNEAQAANIATLARIAKGTYRGLNGQKFTKRQLRVSARHIEEAMMARAIQSGQI